MKQVSIRQVARLAGVSIATVSRCLNAPERVSALTRDRVQQAIFDTGYTPNSLARSFRRGRTNLVMVVLPSVGDPFFSEVMRGVRDETGPRGYSIIITETAQNTLTADEVGAMLVSRQADGIILLASVFPYGPDVLSRARAQAQPIVIGCETLSPALLDLPSVHIDNVAAAADATRHLLALGHRHIAFITGTSTSLLTGDREAGYRAAMREAGLEVHPGWVVEGDMSIAGAERATRALLATARPPTAIFCANDEMAMACMHVLAGAGIQVPAELSVMGFDDTRYAAICRPALTTVAQPAAEIGREVARRLFAAIDAPGSAQPVPVILPHRLVLRDSVAPPPG